MKSINRAGLFVTILTCCGAFTGSAARHPPEPLIPVNSKVYIDTNNGFDIFIAAAFKSKAVPLRLIATKEDAAYVLDSSLFHATELLATSKAAGTYRISEAAFKLTSKDGDIVWAYAATKGAFGRGKQSVAEACAKHIKDDLHL